MNVVRFVANAVKNSTFKAGGSSVSATGQSQLFSNPDTEPHKYEIQILAMHSLSSSNTNTAGTDERLQAIAKMGHLCWIGGCEVAEFAADLYLPTLVNLLKQDSKSHVIHLQVIKTIGEFCCGSKKNQNLASNLSVIGVLIEHMCTHKDDPEMRRWTLHTLFFLLVGNEENQAKALKNPNLKRYISLGARDSWEGWKHNEAIELASMLKLTL